MISLVLVAVFGVPAIADRLTPLVPYTWERKLGDAVDVQLRRHLDYKPRGRGLRVRRPRRRDRGARGARSAGRRGSRPRHPCRCRSRSRCCGRRTSMRSRCRAGRFTCSRASSTGPRRCDQVAGVIGHEIGHVAHRDGMRSLIQAAGLSFLIGMVLGDFAGGGVAAMATQILLQILLRARRRAPRGRLQRRTDDQARRRCARPRCASRAHRRRQSSGHAEDLPRPSRYQGPAGCHQHGAGRKRRLLRCSRPPSGPP